MSIQDKRNSLKGWFFSKEEIARAVEGSILLNPSIDLTNACNLNCPYCYIEEKNSQRKLRHPNELTLEETIGIIDDFHSCGAKTINIVGAGEPTIDPHFREVINHISRLGMTTVLFTNGIRLHNDLTLIEFLYRNDVSVVLKLNSKQRFIQDLVAGRKGYTEKRDRVLEALIDMGFSAQLPTRLGIDSIAFQGNLDELVTLHTWCRQENIFPIMADYIPTGRTEKGEFQGYQAIQEFNPEERSKVVDLLAPIRPQQRADLVKLLAEVDRSLGLARSQAFAYYGGGMCSQILGLYVDIEGNIFPCVARSILFEGQLKYGLLGNTRSGAKVADIWRRHAAMMIIRNGFTGGCPYKAPL